MTRPPDDPLRSFAAKLFGEVLAHVMDTAGMTPQRVASAADLHLSYIYYVMRGGRLPRLSTTERLDKAIGAGGLLVIVRMLLDQLPDAARTPTAAATAGPLMVGPWHLTVDEHGRLVAENHDDGSITVLADKP